MAKLKVIIDFCTNKMAELEEEIGNREYAFDEKSESYQDSDKGQEYESKTKALQELNELLLEVQEKAQKIQDGDYY